LTSPTSSNKADHFVLDNFGYHWTHWIGWNKFTWNPYIWWGKPWFPVGFPCFRRPSPIR
jgi:hypothetical protein